ncbi:MAG: hypothetical protein JXL20_08375 [Deltaproteobacteria bacterium]|nr:hypothetical protein [Deltaproteobacteria bacterium]
MKLCGRLVIGLLFLIGIAACSPVQGYLDIARGKRMSEAYLKALQHWTRSQIVYSQFETKARIEATLRSPEFNRSYHQEYSRIYQLSADERKKGEEMRAATASDFTEFIFYAYIPDRAENDFDRRGSIWSIFLVNGKGEKITPIEVRRIDPVTPVVTEFFPYGNPHYGIFYRLRFPQQQTGRGNNPLKLVFTGVIGKVDLEFQGL